MREVGEPHRLTLPMIDRPPRRIVPTECLGCRATTVSCDASQHQVEHPCCWICRHE